MNKAEKREKRLEEWQNSGKTQKTCCEIQRINN